MDTQHDRREVEYDQGKTRVAPCKHNWRAHHNTVCRCNFEACSEKGIAILSISIACNYSSNTLPAICIEQVVCMKLREDLYCKIFQSPRLPRVTLVPNSQHVQKDVLDTDSRNSDECENEGQQHRETCGSHFVDFRIPGILHSAVGQVETNRKEKVRRLIEQFESHPNKNMLLKDFEKSEEINHFSEESKGFDYKDNNKLFEFYETSSKRQCPDCAAYWEIGIVYCTCGRCMQPTEKNRQFYKDRYGSLSILGYGRTNPEVVGMVNQCVKQCITRHVIC